MHRDELLARISEHFLAFKRRMHTHAAQDSSSLPPAQLALLVHLHHHGPTNGGKLAEHFGMTSSAVTQLLDGLQKHSLIERQADTQDKRRTQIHVSSLGQERLQVLQKQHTDRINKLFTRLDDRELLSFLHLLDKLAS